MAPAEENCLPSERWTDPSVPVKGWNPEERVGRTKEEVTEYGRNPDRLTEEGLSVPEEGAGRSSAVPTIRRSETTEDSFS